MMVTTTEACPGPPIAPPIASTAPTIVVIDEDYDGGGGGCGAVQFLWRRRHQLRQPRLGVGACRCAEGVGDSGGLAGRSRRVGGLRRLGEWCQLGGEGRGVGVVVH